LKRETQRGGGSLTVRGKGEQAGHVMVLAIEREGPGVRRAGGPGGRGVGAGAGASGPGRVSQ
jgi:hypothetical protein